MQSWLKFISRTISGALNISCSNLSPRHRFYVVDIDAICGIIIAEILSEAYMYQIINKDNIRATKYYLIDVISGFGQADQIPVNWNFVVIYIM